MVEQSGSEMIQKADNIVLYLIDLSLHLIAFSRRNNHLLRREEQQKRIDQDTRITRLDIYSLPEVFLHRLSVSNSKKRR